MRATDIPAPWPFDFMAGAKDDMAEMMRHRMPQLFVITVAPQLPKVLMRVAGVTMDSVVIIPSHAPISCIKEPKP